MHLTSPIHATDAEQSGPGRSVRSERLFPWFLLVVALLYLAGLNAHWWPQRDSILYLGLGRSLAETGEFSFNYRPTVSVLPGFPAMLAVLYKVFGESFLAANIMVLFFGIGCVAMAYLLWKESSLSNFHLLACTLLFGFSRTLFYYSHQIMTDVPFTFTALLALYFGAKMLKSEGRRSMQWCMWSALAGCFAILIRPFGLAALAAVAGAMWLKGGISRGPASKLGRTALLLAPVAVLGGLWAVRCIAYDVSIYQADYFSKFLGRRGLAGLGVQVLSSVPELVKALPDAMFGSALGTTVSVLLLALLLLGLIVSLRAGERLLSSYGIIYLAGICLGEPGRRYLLPVLPVLLYWLCSGLAAIGRWVVEGRKFPRREHVIRAAYVLLGLALAFNVVRIGILISLSRSSHFYEAVREGRYADYFVLADWLKGNAGPEVVVLAKEYRVLHYFSRVKTMDLPYRQIERGPERPIPSRQRPTIMYVVRESKDEERAAFMDSLMRAKPQAFEKVRSFGEVELYRLDTVKLGERGA